MIQYNTRGFGSPSRYFQGPGEINHIKEHTLSFGRKVYMLIDEFFFEKLTKQLQSIYSDNKDTLETDLFSGEITDDEIERVLLNVKSSNPDVVVGVGGGKTLDTIKVVANDLHLPVIIVPTTASTDAPCSAMSIIYHLNGAHHHVRYYTQNPDVVLVDSEIICKAPIRFFIAGMGDAISTYFEARANEVAGNNNYVNLNHGGGYRPTKAAMALAKLCYELILGNGVQAKQDVLAGNCTEAVENIIEANTLLSGLGFENTGCAGAHAFNDAFVNIVDGSKLLHGEKVAFGVLVQLVVENCDLLELKKLYRFYYDVGLPMALEDLGINITDGVGEAIARASMGTLWESEPMKVNWRMVNNAILKADLQGKVFRGVFSKGMETFED